MTVDQMRNILGCCLIINSGFLAVWFISFMAAHDWMYGVHSKWFKISVEQFDAIHYAGLAFLKVSVIFLNLVPFLALLIVG